jgi:tRNA (mo5U34)-methyltransferase
MDLAEQRRQNPIGSGLQELGLYHSFRLPDGRILQGANSLELQEQRLASFALPDRLDGKTVLDIGPWDGYFTFEMERRGATVTATDYVDLDTFRALHKTFHSAARYLRLDVSELTAERVGTFDIVLCLGVLYHLRYPIEGLEKICAISKDICIVDTFVSNGREWLAGERPPLPYAEFYERQELGGQVDNWWGPNVSAVAAWIRAAGFARAELLCVTPTTARYAAYRHWADLPAGSEPAIALVGLHNHADRGHTFQSNKEEYIILWSEWSHPEPALETVYPEVDGFGAAPIFCSVTDGKLQTAIRVPPGLAPGKHEARLKIGSAAWSSRLPFYLDLPPLTTPIQLLSAQDGMTWTMSQVDWQRGGWLTIWLSGLSPEADPGNVVVFINEVPHSPEDVQVKTGQVNLRLRPIMTAGKHEVYAAHRGARSNLLPITVLGSPPPIHGLTPSLADQPRQLPQIVDQ